MIVILLQYRPNCTNDKTFLVQATDLSLFAPMVSYLVEFGVCQIHFSYAQIIFPASFAGQVVLYKDPTVWLDGARPSRITLINLTNS
jgi:hypothetical protein